MYQQPPQQPLRGQQPPPQWQPQPNISYSPQWQQPSPQYPPYQQQYYPPPMLRPPMRQPPPKKNGIPRWLYVFVGVVVVLACISFGLVGQQGQTSTPDTSNAQPTDTPVSDTPTVASTTSPSINIAPVVGAPVIGADVGTFVTRYGEPQEELSSGYFNYKDGDGKIYLNITVENGRVNAILDDISINWTPAQAKAACMTFLPSDSTYERKDNVFLAGSLSSVDYVYHSSSLANRFPAKDFTDENGNQATRGTFELNVNNITDNTADCDVQVGLQGT